MIDFLLAILGPTHELGLYAEIRAMKDGRVVQNFEQSVDIAQERALAFDRQGYDVYYGVQPRLRPEGTADATRPSGNVLWADLDGKGYRNGKAGAFQALAGVSPRPQIVVDSGHGYHGYWLLDDFYPYRDLRSAMRGIELVTGADNCSDAPRVLRIPGTLNHKDVGVPLLVRLVKFDLLQPRHRLSDFADYVEAGLPVEMPRRSTSFESVDGWEPVTDDAPKFPEGTRNQSLTRLAGIMVARGLGYDEMLVALGRENEVRCDPPLPEREVVSIVRSVQRYR